MNSIKSAIENAVIASNHFSNLSAVSGFGKSVSKYMQSEANVTLRSLYARSYKKADDSKIELLLEFTGSVNVNLISEDFSYFIEDLKWFKNLSVDVKDIRNDKSNSILISLESLTGEDVLEAILKS